MVYITGDTHGDFRHTKRFCNIAETSKKDTIIILGDSGINYFTDMRCLRYKETVENMPIKVFCIHGNHEERAELIPGYQLGVYWGGHVMYEPNYPSILFAIDGEVYSIPSKNGVRKSMAIGGAYSVDKGWRLMNGDLWYPSEQPSDEIKSKVEYELDSRNWKIDTILSHTCPYRYIPYEWFISGIDQSTVDNSTEIWLDSILSRLKSYKKWYCGHYHGEKKVDKLEFMFNSIKEF